MSASALFEVAESTRLDARLLVARHLRRHPLLPDPHTITVDQVWQRVRVQFLPEPDRELRDLLTWHESLRAPVAQVWRTADGGRLIASTFGQTGNGLPVEVFTGLDHDEALFTSLVEPDAGQPVTRDELKRAATIGLRRAARPAPDAPNTDTALAELTEAQSDGLACVICGTDYLRIRLAHVPVSRSLSGSQVFACVGRCSALARHQYAPGGGGR
jgi:hypothetical protein